MRSIKIVFGLLTALVAQSCVSYLWHVGTGQLNIICKRRKITQVLKNRNIELETRSKLKLILHARNYAQEQLGFRAGQSYTYYTQLERSYVAYNVTASAPLKLEPYTWYFPIAGRVPYKGFFEKKKALAEAKCLAEEGYDTRLSPVAAYSTLGWFDDPVLSPFLNQDDSEIIALVFHEMAHATLYIPSDTLFNESFASFIEEKATAAYLKKFYGEADLLAYQESLVDFRLYVKIMKEIAKELSSLYQSKKTDIEKRKQKQKILLAGQARGQVAAFKNKKYQNLFRRKLNNTHFLSLQRYHSGGFTFEKIYLQKRGNLTQFISAISLWKSFSKEKRKKLLLTEK